MITCRRKSISPSTKYSRGVDRSANLLIISVFQFHDTPHKPFEKPSGRALKCNTLKTNHLTEHPSPLHYLVQKSLRLLHPHESPIRQLSARDTTCPNHSLHLLNITYQVFAEHTFIRSFTSFRHQYPLQAICL